MRYKLLVLLFWSVLHTYGQVSFAPFDSTTHLIQSIDPKNTNYDDLAFLKSILKDKQVVLLGEQEHGDGASLSAKIRLIQFLHQEMGFNVIAFETGFYQASTSWDLYQDSTINFEQMITGTLQLKQWIKPQEMTPLFDLIKKGGFSLAGIDLCYDLNQTDRKVYLYTIDSIEQVVAIKPNPNFKAAAVRLLNEGISSNPSAMEKEAFANHLDTLIAALDAYPEQKTLQFWRQELKGLRALGLGWWQKDAHTRKNWWSSGNLRDQQMAETIVWLQQNKFKGEKMIVWAANYHISRLVSTEVKKDKYFQNDNAIPMGEVLHQQLGNCIYAIGMCSFSGERTLVEHNFEKVNIKPRSAGSYEAYLHAKKYPYAFTDFRGNQQSVNFKLAGLSHYQLTGNWTKVFDGLFFIDNMQPLTIKDLK